MAKKIEPFTSRFYGVLPARVNFLVDLYKIPKEKVELLVMGADDEVVEIVKYEKTKFNIREKHGIRKDDFLVVTGGKIDEAKIQTLLLIKSVKKLNDEKVKLIVFGSVVDSLKPKLEELCDGKNIQYIGWIDANESYRYFEEADIVVFPGRHSVFWEQVAGQGIPIICKYWEGTDHINIDGNVLFINEDSEREIYYNLRKVIYNEKIYSNMKKSANRNAHKFLYSNIAKKSIDEGKYE